MLSPTELKERLKQAADVVEHAALPEELRPIAFEHSLHALGVGSASAGAGDQQQPRRTEPDETESVGTRGGGVLGKIAKRLGLDYEVVAQVFDEEDGQVRLVVRRAMLPEPSRKAASMRHVALLVVIGRQAAGIDEYTAYDAIREECRELKIYDGPNFSTEVGKLEFRTRGGRNSKEAKANRHHYDEAADLVRRMSQEGES
jgi:hypothetical protein